MERDKKHTPGSSQGAGRGAPDPSTSEPRRRAHMNRPAARRSAGNSSRRLRQRVPEQGRGLFLLVLAWFVVEYVRPQDYLPILAAVRPALLMLVIMALVWLMRADKSALGDNVLKLWIAFIAIGSTSVFWARNNNWAMQDNLLLISFLVGGVLPFLAFVNTPARLKRFFDCWILFHLFIGIAGILRGGTGSGNFMRDENDLALTMAMGLPYAWFTAVSPTRSRRARLVSAFAIVVMVAAIVISMSRGGFLGLLAVGFAIVWFSQKRFRNALLVLLAAAIMLVMVPAGYKEEMGTITNAEDSTRQTRIYYWSRGLEMFADHPFLGVGSGNFGWRIHEYEIADPDFRSNRALSGGRVAHSVYFTLIPEYGAVGSLLFAAMVVGMWRRLSASRALLERAPPGPEREILVSYTRSALAAMVAFLVSGAFLSVLYYPHIWYLLGFTLAFHHFAQGLSREPVTARQKPATGRSLRAPAREPAS